MDIKVIDSHCGSGKTSAVIDLINRDTSGNKYMFITPFLTEVERVKNCCKKKKFKEPIFSSHGNKANNLKYLVANGENIVTTHALFKKISLDIVDLIKSHNYILILDETFNVLEEYNLSEDDFNLLKSKGLIELKGNKLKWCDYNSNTKKQYKGRFENLRYLALNNNLIMSNGILFWTFPVEIFKAFKEVYILTYMFKCQNQYYYYKMHNINCQYYYAYKNSNSDYCFKEYDSSYVDNNFKNNLRSLMTIIDDPKLNAVGNSKFALSKKWYAKQKNKAHIVQLKNNLYNLFNNKLKAKSNNILWTCFKADEQKLKGKGYTKSFIPCNARAVNNYSNRMYLAYCINVFPRPVIKNFFLEQGIVINESDYAISEMLQWIGRSGIRQNKSIVLYIPSARMRDLLINWLNSGQR